MPQTFREGAESIGRKRILLVVNPYATTVSRELKNLVVYALQARYEVEAVETQASGHATAVASEAAREDFDLVVSFGGDGTLNEVANGLAGSDTPVSVLPGGSTNVVCRSLGIPTDLVDAAEHLIAIADEFTPREIDLGVVNGRRFLFASGFGLDADVVRRVDERPDLKGSAGKWFYAYSALTSYYSYCLGSPPGIRVRGGRLDGMTGVTAVVQNSSPFTYFGGHPIELCPDVSIDDGHLGLAVLERFAQRDAPSLIPRLLSGRLAVTNSRMVRSESDLDAISLEAVSRDGEYDSLPLHVDGDFIGRCTAAEYSIQPAALRIVC